MANSTASTAHKVFCSANLDIRGNLLLFPGTCMQISNISQVFYGNIPRRKFPTLPFIILLLGGISDMAIGFPDSHFATSPACVVGMIAVISAIIIAVVDLNQPLVYGLHVVMNAGTTYTFTSSDSQFIEKAHDAVCECINQSENEPNCITLNFGDGRVVTLSD